MTLSTTYSYAVTEHAEHDSIAIDSPDSSIDAPRDLRSPKKYVSTRSQTRPQPYLLILGIGILLTISLVIVHIHQALSASVWIFRR